MEDVKIIKDSIGPCGKRAITMEVTYWRAIHSEMMTHRMFSRNAASSRAIPFYREKNGSVIENCTYSKIKDSGFVPEFLGSEKPGMQSGSELSGDDRDNALELIDAMRKFCLVKCKDLHLLGLHKSIINRYLEPWSYITVLITATEWNNFFRLRCHPAAEKHFQKIARMMKDAIDTSVPMVLQENDWHLPYIDTPILIRQHLENNNDLDFDWTEGVRRISAARCARLSYLTHNGVRDFDEDLKLFEKLIEPKREDGSLDDAIHASPLEHVLQAKDNPGYRSGNVFGWRQYRGFFPKENMVG